jgi:predicted Fe-Mo cluster-binding NifX family protein
MPNIFALCLLYDRITPRYDRAEKILLVTSHSPDRLDREIIPVRGMKPQEVCNMLLDRNVDTLICGGVTAECRARLELSRVRILDNVMGSAEGVITVYLNGALTSGLEVN